MDASSISERLLKALGGKENVVSNDACMTRLRVRVRDMSLVDVEAIRRIDGVMGVVPSDTLQVVFGPGTANEVLGALIALTGIPRNSNAAGVQNAEDAIFDKSEASSVAKQNRDALNKAHNGVVRTFLNHVANVFVPLLPGIVGAGLINGLANVINVLSNGALSGVWWYECIRTMGWALFAYLPIFAGYNAAREFGGSPILGGVAGAVCVANAAMPLLDTFNGNQVILPMTGAVYNPASGGLLAALLAGGVFAWLERTIRRLMPNIIDSLASPFLVLVIGSLAIVVVLQPVGAALTQGIYFILNFVNEKLGIVGGYILASIFLPLVSVGLHQALTPIHAMLNDPSGPTHGINYLLPVLMMAGGGQVGAGIALYLRTRNKKLRGYIRDSIPVAILGVGEPLMYAVTLPLGKCFVTACLGAGFGGAVARLFGLGTITQGVSGLFGLLIVQPGQEWQFVVSLLVACAGGFVLTWLFGVDETRIDEVYETDVPVSASEEDAE